MDIFYNGSKATYQTPTPSSTSKEKAPSTAPTSPPKAALGQLTTSQFHEMEKIRQKLLQQQEDLRRMQEEASPAPSPTLKQGFIPGGNYAYFNYQPQSPLVSLPQVSHQPMNFQTVNLQRCMHPSQYRQERPTPQPAQGEEKQQSLRQLSSANDGAAAVPQPVTTQPQGIATPSQVERQLPAETLKIFNFVGYAELRQADVYFFFKSGQQVLIIYDNLEVFLRQNATDNRILLRRHSKALTNLTEKAAWITLKATDVVTINGDWHRYLQTCSK